MSDVTIRPFDNADLDVLARLMTALGYATSTEEMSGRMAVIGKRADFMTFVAEAADEIVGMVGVSIAPSYEHNAPVGRVVAMVVAEDSRRHGVGALLMRRAEGWLAERNVGRIAVTSGLAREGAHAFYRRLGYDQTGLRFVKVLEPRGG